MRARMFGVPVEAFHRAVGGRATTVRIAGSSRSRTLAATNRAETVTLFTQVVLYGEHDRRAISSAQPSTESDHAHVPRLRHGEMGVPSPVRTNLFFEWLRFGESIAKALAPCAI
jgi:hypothetical protein